MKAPGRKINVKEMVMSYLLTEIVTKALTTRVNLMEKVCTPGVMVKNTRGNSLRE